MTPTLTPNRKVWCSYFSPDSQKKIYVSFWSKSYQAYDIN